MLVAEVSGLRYFFLLRLLRFVIVLRTPPDRIASAARSDCERRPPVNDKRLLLSGKTNNVVINGLKAQQSHSPGQRPG